MSKKYDYETFHELFIEVLWSWGSQDHEKPVYYGEGCYNINKLTIMKDQIEYKGNYNTISPKAYDGFVKFIKFMENVDD